MAALGKIRSKGVILICVIGFALFAFIAEELVRSSESMRNDSRQQVGKVLGEKISVQDFQALVDEYQEVMKMQGRDNLSEEELNQVKDQVWQTYISSALIENEAKKLGLTVTDQELQNILKEGTNQMLLQTPFVNQQTGRFDANLLKKFLAEYKTAQTQNPQVAEQYQTMYKYWTFIEKTLRQQTLATKYQALLASCLISNNIEAKMAYKDANEEANIDVAAFPYADVKDTEAKVTDADIKAKYDELKEMFLTTNESRDIKYVSFEVKASQADRAATLKSVKDFAAKLAVADDPTEVIRKSQSEIAYLGVPVSKNAFPADLKIDSIAVGATTAVTENTQDNTYNVVRLYSKAMLPDSIQFQAISVAKEKADSVFNAVKAGGDFAAIAKKYSQTGDSTWLSTAQYEHAPSIDKDTKTYLTTLNNAAVGEVVNLALGNGNLIIKILNHKGSVEKYVAAAIKRTIDFSKDTYSQAYNKFSQFVSESQNLSIDEFEKHAKKNGYTVNDQPGITTAAHNIANIRATREALKWLFDAEKGNISPLYECGDNNTLLVLACENINEKGYLPLDNKQVNEFCKTRALNDKKAEFIMSKINGVKDLAAAKAKGGKEIAVNQVTFASPAFIQVTGSAEPAVSGAVAATKAGAFVSHPVKGEAGVYLFKVLSKKNRPGKFNAQTELQQLRQRNLQYAGNFMSELYQNADVTDNRYLFF